MGEISREVRELLFIADHKAVSRTMAKLEADAQIGLDYWWKRFQNLRQMTRPFRIKVNEQMEDVENHSQAHLYESM